MNIQEPLVTVIVATFNRYDLIGETILSILNQTYNNIELIIVDDGSTDNTKKIIDGYKDDRIKYIKTKNWGGAARPRNIGIMNASGEYLAFCDDDDLWKHDKLTKQMSVMLNASPRVEICFANFDYLLDGKVTAVHNYKKWYKNLTFNKFILSNGCVALSSSIFHKRVLNNISLFSEDRDLIALEDYELFARIIKRNRAVYLEEVLVSYRVHAGSIQRRIEDRHKKNLRMLASINRQVGINPFIYILRIIKTMLA